MSTITIQQIGSKTPGILTGDLTQDIISGTTTANSTVSIYYDDAHHNKTLLGVVTSNASGAFTFPLTAQVLALIGDTAANGALTPLIENLSASVSDSNGITTSPVQHFLTFPKANAIGANGLYVQDIKIGTGSTALTGELAVVDYTGYLSNGTVFDSSITRNQPFAFAVGAGQVIQGWDQGVAGMHLGGERLLVIPASLGYGANAVGSIPANSSLVFDVKLLQLFNPVSAVVNWDALHGQVLSASDAAVFLFGGTYSGNGQTYQALSQQFGNNLDLSSQTTNSMAFAASSGNFTLKGSNSTISFLFGGAGSGTLDGSASSAPKFLFAGTGDTIILGGSSDDFIQAGAGHDRISAGLGNNVIYSGAGSAVIDGGAGTNLLYYNGAPDQYSITKSGNGLVVSANSGNPYKAGADIISQISDIIFQSTNTATGAPSSIDILQNLTTAVDKSVYLLYQAAFGRKPDRGGLVYWAGQADNLGVNISSIANSFVTSTEFTAKYGANPTNLDYVSALYQNVLGRAPEQSGLDYWVRRANAGMSHQDILISFATSQENIAITTPHTTIGLWTTL